MRHLVGSSRNEIAVYVDLVHSQAATSIARHPYLLGLVQQAVQRTAINGSEMTIEQDMGHVVGYDFVIPTTDKDSIVYARLFRDDLYTRFVKSNRPHPTQYLTVMLQRSGTDYELQDTWIGRLRPPRPGSSEETSASKLYWADHAYVLGGQNLQLSTITKDCPY